MVVDGRLLTQGYTIPMVGRLGLLRLSDMLLNRMQFGALYSHTHTPIIMVWLGG
jgi:hypothetical protein